MARLFTQLDVNTRGSLEEFELIRELEQPAFVDQKTVSMEFVITILNHQRQQILCFFVGTIIDGPEVVAHTSRNIASLVAASGHSFLWVLQVAFYL